MATVEIFMKQNLICSVPFQSLLSYLLHKYQISTILNQMKAEPWYFRDLQTHLRLSKCHLLKRISFENKTSYFKLWVKSHTFVIRYLKTSFSEIKFLSSDWLSQVLHLTLVISSARPCGWTTKTLTPTHQLNRGYSSYWHQHVQMITINLSPIRTTSSHYSTASRRWHEQQHIA